MLSKQGGLSAKSDTAFLREENVEFKYNKRDTEFRTSVCMG